MTEVDVVIISWAKTPELREITQRCLDTLYASEVDIRFNPVIVESNPDVEYNWGVTIHPKDEFGYNKYCNLGRKVGKAPYVVLCNNDITFEAGWATVLIAAMTQKPQFRSMTPWCPQVHGDQNGKSGMLIEGYLVRRELGGWCIFQDRTIYDEIGDLDENIVFWFCDNDYGLTLMEKGIKHCLVADSTVNHNNDMVGATMNALDEETQNKYMWDCEKYVKNKWKDKIPDISRDKETKSN